MLRTKNVQSDTFDAGAWPQFGPSLGVPMDRRAFTLQPLIAQGILHPGDNRLSCAVGGIDYFAGKMPESIGPMHRFLLALFALDHTTSIATRVTVNSVRNTVVFVLLSSSYQCYPP